MDFTLITRLAQLALEYHMTELEAEHYTALCYIKYWVVFYTVRTPRDGWTEEFQQTVRCHA